MGVYADPSLFFPYSDEITPLKCSERRLNLLSLLRGISFFFITRLSQKFSLYICGLHHPYYIVRFGEPGLSSKAALISWAPSTWLALAAHFFRANKMGREPEYASFFGHLLLSSAFVL